MSQLPNHPDGSGALSLRIKIALASLAVLVSAFFIVDAGLYRNTDIQVSRTQNTYLLSAQAINAAKPDFSANAPLRPSLLLHSIKESDGKLKANISVNQGKVRGYGEGEFLAEGIRVARIGRNEVYLQETRKVERLQLGKILAETASSNSKHSKLLANQVAPDIENNTAATVRFPEGTTSKGIEKIQENQYLVDRKLVNEQISRGYVFKHARFDRLKTGGFSINDIAQGSLYEKMGLHNGDIIRELNGKPISSLTDVIATYKDYMIYDHAELIISRSGKQKALLYLMR